MWMGDFNTVMDNHLDRTSLASLSDSTPSPTRFGKLVNEIGLLDAWRSRHASVKAFTCFSATHNTMSRIDLILISHSLAPNLKRAGLSPRILSDHAPCWIELEVGSPPLPMHGGLTPFGSQLSLGWIAWGRSGSSSSAQTLTQPLLTLSGICLKLMPA